MIRNLLIIFAATLCGCAIFSDIGEVRDGDDTGAEETPVDDVDVPDAAGDAGRDTGPPAMDMELDVIEPPEDMPADSNPMQDVAPDVGDDTGPDMPSCESPLVIASPEHLWSTPNTIRWEWSWVRDDIDLVTLEIVMGLTPEDVRNRKDVIVFTGDEMSELAVVSGDNRQSEGSTWGLEPDTKYYAQFGSLDTDGCRSKLPIVSATTSRALPNEYVLFSEDPTDGYSIPDDFAYSNRNPGGGLFHYEWLADCNGDPACFQILRRQDLSDVVDIPDAAFDDAIVEFMALNEGSVHGEYWQARMSIGPEGGRDFWATPFMPHLGPTKVWRVHQIPLSMFEANGQPLTAAEFSGQQIFEWGIGAQFEDGTYGNWDEVRFRW